MCCIVYSFIWIKLVLTLYYCPIKNLLNWLRSTQCKVQKNRCYPCFVQFVVVVVAIVFFHSTLCWMTRPCVLWMIRAIGPVKIPKRLAPSGDPTPSINLLISMGKSTENIPFNGKYSVNTLQTDTNYSYHFFLSLAFALLWISFHLMTLQFVNVLVCVIVIIGKWMWCAVLLIFPLLFNDK